MGARPCSKRTVGAVLLAIGCQFAPASKAVETRVNGPSDGPLTRSDVLFSPRTGGRAADETNWQRAAAAFGATRLVWVYTSGPKFRRTSRALGYPVQVAVPFYVDGKKQPNMQCLDIYGGPARRPYEARWDGRRPDINSQAFRHFERYTLERRVDTGYTSFQQDDPALNAVLAEFGGCFSAESMAKFNAYLRAHVPAATLQHIGVGDLAHFNYRSYLLKAGAPAGAAFAAWKDPIKPYFVAFERQSTADYLKWLHRSIRAYAHAREPSSHIYFSANLGADALIGRPWLQPLFDYWVSECRPDSGGAILKFAKLANANGAVNGVVFNQAGTLVNQKAVATAYAAGLVPVAPWDVFVGSASERYFADPNDFRPLYGLVRRYAGLFDRFPKLRADHALAPDVVAMEDASGGSKAVAVLKGVHVTIPAGSIVAIGDSFYTTAKASANGAIYLSEPEGVSAIGGPIWYVRAPRGRLIYTQPDYNDVPALEATSGYVTAVGNTKFAGQVRVQWNKQGDLRGIPAASTVAIGSRTYQTSAPTKGGFIYLKPEIGRIKAGSPVWYVRSPSGKMLYNGSANIVVTVRESTDGKQSVVHVVNWGDAPAHIAVKVPRAFLQDTPRRLITPDASSTAAIVPQFEGENVVYDLGPVRVWALLAP